MNIETITLTERERDILRAIKQYENPLNESSLHQSLRNTQERMIETRKWISPVFHFEKISEISCYSRELQEIIENLISKRYIRRDEHKMLYVMHLE